MLCQIMLNFGIIYPMCDFLLMLLPISKPAVFEYRSTVYITLGVLEFKLFLNGNNRVCSTLSTLHLKKADVSVQRETLGNVSSTTFSFHTNSTALFLSHPTFRFPNFHRRYKVLWNLLCQNVMQVYSLENLGSSANWTMTATFYIFSIYYYKMFNKIHKKKKWAYIHTTSRANQWSRT
jgi:hypothetical protein